jgi:hypothetical protein
VVLSKSLSSELEMLLITYFPQPNEKIFKWKFYGVWNWGSIKWMSLVVLGCLILMTKMLLFDNGHLSTIWTIKHNYMDVIVYSCVLTVDKHILYGLCQIKFK